MKWDKPHSGNCLYADEQDKHMAAFKPLLQSACIFEHKMLVSLEPLFLISCGFKLKAMLGPIAVCFDCILIAVYAQPIGFACAKGISSVRLRKFN